ncbi:MULTISPECIES: baseplate J/gp47 family protein [Brevibacillus]|uniref:baseplate assembly protein n=1 Tax=Brevibacillus TaxID=55080 RepID=UPI000D0FC5DE|nr:MULTISPECIES: baseplate J/gp47 family protein [Brevibacillus]MED1947076.1 baseplate J/gp47 family protein [Brevibacillus formosus]MED2000448.1 baseplate J/gp47 family protein [Brevibacillus formosus]MED2085763.1 baseplate J/gp47 family protein [Brevibacillus formosus]PSK13476.1 baseplate J protein [Brevibacillus sp. NRRL NRS-603]
MSRFDFLPDVSFANKSPQQIEADLIANYEKEYKKPLAAADPVRLFIKSIVPFFVQQRVIIDDSAKQNLLKYARGKYLDLIGILLNVVRILATKAKTTVRFTLSTPVSQTIPKGTRVTAGDNVFFATTVDVTVSSGETKVEVKAECVSVGVIGNGYPVGKLNQLVDPLPFVQSVSNVTESGGGADEEDDDSYAERIRQAPESFSVAGPSGAYEFWAKSASTLLGDVNVSSPRAGVVEIRPLLKTGEIPDQTIIDLVAAVCNDRKIRPLTDQVFVLAPTQKTYNIEATYWIDTDKESAVTAIQAKVNQAVADYQLWQRAKLGRDIDPSELVFLMKKAGAKRVSVTSPVFTTLTESEVAKEHTVNVVYGGLESG